MAILDRVARDSDPYSISINDKERDNKYEGISQAQRRPLSYPTPTSDWEMRRLIARAELEGDPQVVAVYDRALAPYCTDRRNLRGLLHEDIRLRFLCLDFPTSKTNLIGTLNPVIGTRSGRELAISHRVKDDQNSALSAMLKESCTQSRLFMLQEKHKPEAFFQNPSEFTEIFQQFGGRENAAQFFSKYDTSTLFCYLLSLINPSEDVNQDICNALFRHLCQPSVWEKSSEEAIRDFIWLVLHHPFLLSQLQKDSEDQIEIQCTVRSCNQTVTFTASRFLLCTQSEYFNSLLTQKDEPLEMLDLSKTSFGNRTIELLLRWISHLRTGVFAFDGETTIGELSNVLTAVSAFGLINQKEFEEAIIIELKKRLTMDTLCEITQIGLLYHFNLLVAFCVRFINSYEGGNLHVKVDEQGFYEVVQSKDGRDLPEQAYEALALLGSKIRTASIETFRPQAPKGCCSRVVNRLSSLSHSFWDKCGGLIKRTASFALSIFVIEKMARKEWVDERDFPLSVGLGIVYPLVHKAFSRCTDRMLRNHPTVVSLPGMIPLRLQFRACETLLAVQENVYGCATSCFRGRRNSAAQPLISVQNPILNALPNTLQCLNVSQATDLTNDDCTRISLKYPRLKRLEFGSHPCLNGRNFQFLTQLNLQELSFNFRRGEKAFDFEFLRLDQLLPHSALKVEISLFDSTLVYLGPSFLRNLPLAATLHVTLKHVPIPSWLVLFESPSGRSQEIAWPGVSGSLSVLFPRMNALDCYGPISDDDLDIMSDALAPCRRLVLRQGSLNVHHEELTNTAIKIIADNCPHLEELFIGVSPITSVQPLVDKEIPLKRIALRECYNLNNTALEQLATLPTLSSCYLNWIPEITNPGVQKLLDSPAMQECLATACHGITTPMLMQLFYHKNPSKNGIMKKIVHETLQLLKTPMPQQLANKLFLPIIFSSMHTILPMLGVHDDESIRGLFGFTPEEHIFESPLSLHEATAQFSWSLESWLLEVVSSTSRAAKVTKEWEIGNGRRKQEDVPFSPLEQSEVRLFALYCLNPELTSYRGKIASAYRVFLAQYYSNEYLHEVEMLVTDFMTEFKAQIAFNGNALQKSLQEVMVLAFLDQSRAMLRLAQLFLAQNPEFSKDIFLNFAQNIKTKGDAISWSNEQRMTPVFAALLFNLNFFSEMLVPVDQSSFSGTIVIFDEKEEMKERKKEKKMDVS